MTDIPAIAITPGEPAGIGPDILIQLIQEPITVPLVAIADRQLLQERARQLQLPLTLHPCQPGQTLTPLPATELYIDHISLNVPCSAGQLDNANADYVLNGLTHAIEACMTKQYAALLTCPVNKACINDAGYDFTGHTEFLMQHSGSAQVVMMLACQGLRVALATTHLPLAEVAANITRQRLDEILDTLYFDLQNKFHIDDPHITVLGLNPHAGEQGHLGHEEIDIISPCISARQQAGWRIAGPLPADTAFVPQQMAHTDAFLAMYHDQGLPVLKHFCFGKAVNITLGLPFIRTSVDHGTALTLAGTGKADVSSLRQALQLTIEMLDAN